MIELGLGRISRLLKDNPVAWRAIHVAGTNGKGSVCSYASAMLLAGNVRCGRFTSPHLIDRWDCISINDKVVDIALFRRAEKAVLCRNQRDNIQASEFELLTATAFEVFNLTKVEVGVVEVGLGGKYDATNVLRDPLVTVITKIGKDHEAFLGDSLDQIAHHKAGIMKQSTPCVADGSNAASVVKVLQEEAKVSHAAYLRLIPQDMHLVATELRKLFKERDFQNHQQMNITVAYEAVKIAMDGLGLSPDPYKLVSAVRCVSWPGRLQTVDLYPLVGQAGSILLDGAHNAQSAQVLGAYVDRHLRHSDKPVTWIIAISKGKDIQEILKHLLQPGDSMFAESFGPVESMPWVQPTPVEELLEAATSVDGINVIERSGDLIDTIRSAIAVAGECSIVVAGSLYLVSDVLRRLRDSEQL